VSRSAHSSRQVGWIYFILSLLAVAAAFAVSRQYHLSMADR
jgi:hypothetical protein